MAQTTDFEYLVGEEEQEAEQQLEATTKHELLCEPEMKPPLLQTHYVAVLEVCGRRGRVRRE